MIYISFLVIFFSLTIPTLANCNFKTANYLEELSTPSNIKSIVVEVPQSNKFNRNFLKILVSKDKNISPSLKKSYKAKISVNYKFGMCNYTGSVRQHGDWKDHVRLEDGYPLRSIQVKLDEGNIMNSVRFKLLIPDTRNDLHEILGTLLMKELGFIVPETFQVRTKINNISGKMLFQENSNKELLERNNRREGPIFEGDESLLWSYKNYKNFILEPLSLSRLVNHKWFSKGENSQKISLNAYEKLQIAYLNFSQSKDRKKELNTIHSLNNVNNEFVRYFLSLISMNGFHALRPHNRQFYYNSFLQNFEPIYYDGMLNLHKKVSILPEDFNYFRITNDFKLEIDKIIEIFENSQNTFSLFKERTEISEKELKKFYDKSVTNLINNLNYIKNNLNNKNNFKITNKSRNDLIKSYLNFQKTQDLNQSIIINIKNNDNDYIVETNHGEKFSASFEEISKLISKNSFKDKRAVYFPIGKKLDQNLINSKMTIDGQNVHFIHSKGLIITIDEKIKEISFSQSNQNDWVLIKNLVFDNWKINFFGISHENYNDGIKERYNEYGFTGCLNFYRVAFINNIINANNGNCEDVINIVNSKGNIEYLSVDNATADGLDIDFSIIKIDNLNIKNSFNDCVDVSAGSYQFNKVNLLNCSDKGLSIGEKSNLFVKEITINNSNIAVSSKDMSHSHLSKADFYNVDLCYEAKQKKREFGGSKMIIENINCNKSHSIDQSSIVQVNNL